MRTAWMTALLLAASPRAQDQDQDPARQELVRAFATHGVHLDLDARYVSIGARVDVLHDLIEYLLVSPHGAAHESLFLTDVVPSRLNAALLLLEVQPGRNAEWKRKDPPPTAEEMRDGVPPWTVEAPSGDGLHLYVGWQERGETYFFRVDDLIRNLQTGRAMQRHPWVFLGSRMARKRSGEEVFVADLDGNLVCVSFFPEGNTLLTAALPECLSQVIWIPNAWLLPSQGSPVELVFSRVPLEAPPASLRARLPRVDPPQPGGSGGR